jgi:hypothetical protein
VSSFGKFSSKRKKERWVEMLLYNIITCSTPRKRKKEKEKLNIKYYYLKNVFKKIKNCSTKP